MDKMCDLFTIMLVTINKTPVTKRQGFGFTNIVTSHCHFSFLNATIAVNKPHEGFSK
jgi:hypothetical protein